MKKLFNNRIHGVLSISIIMIALLLILVPIYNTLIAVAESNFIEVDVYQNGVFYKTYTINGNDDNWYKKIDVPKYNDSGKLYSYEIIEKPVEGYTSSIETTTIGNDQYFFIVNTAKNYTVSYHENYPAGLTGTGTKPTDSNNYAYGKTATVLGKGDLSLDEYIFTGWATSPTGPSEYMAGDGITITDNVDLFAVWKKELKYTVRYLPGLHGTFSAQTTNNLISGATTPAAPTATGEAGYTFTGWSPSLSPTVTDNVDYIAQWELIPTYVVRYLPGLHGTFSAQTTSNLISGATTPAAPTATGKEGYTFIGWSPILNPTVTDNVDYIAQWEPIPTYVVRYLPGTNGTFATQTTSNLISGVATPTAPTATGKEGYTFIGWSPSRASTVTKSVDYTAQWELIPTYTVRYLPGQYGTFAAQTTTNLLLGAATPASPGVTGQTGYRFTGWSPTRSDIVTGSVDYTALWELIPTYTVRYLPGSRGMFATQTTTNLSMGQATPTAPTVTGEIGYTFTGWSPTRTMTVTGSVDYVAQWTIEIIPSYTVIFQDYDGKELKVEEIEKGKNASAPNTPEREGYLFTGWLGTFTNVQSDITVTAQYKEKEETTKTAYTVQFVDYDGAVLKTEQVEQGNNASAPTSPTRSGYTFTGWNRSFSDIQENITVTAQYETIATLTPAVEVPTHEEVVEQLKEEGIPTITIGGLEIPLAAGSMGEFVWALLNLILAIAGVILLVVAIIRFLTRNRKEERILRPVWLIVSILMGIVGLAIFLLTEDMKLSMVLTDKWTIPSTIVLGMGIVSLFLTFKRNDDIFES